MITQIRYIESIETDPYENLGLEEYLLTHCQADEVILYLWQNKNTVVIGRNQNAWKECRIQMLEREGGSLARRLSGGGAVYHDLGNLNFTFLARKENYELSRQLDVILGAMQSLGIPAQRSGRNDLLCRGRKFSGNAFYEQGAYYYHHGTIMVDVDKEKLSRYLNPAQDKLESKGVDSVRSRVMNLTDEKINITVGSVKNALRSSFSAVYGKPVRELALSDLDEEEIDANRQKMASWEWKYGRKIPFTLELEHRFDFGRLDLQLVVERGIVKDAAAYSDALTVAPIQALPGRLTGIRFDRQELCRALYVDRARDPAGAAMTQEIIDWLSEQDI